MRIRQLVTWLLLSLLVVLTTGGVAAARGKESPPRPAGPWSGTPIGPADPAWTFHGRWTSTDGDGRSHRAPRDAADGLALEFTGTGVDLDVVLDGNTRFVAEVDGRTVGTRGYSGVGPASIRVVQGLAPGPHTLVLRAADDDPLPAVAAARTHQLPGPAAGTVARHEGRVAVAWTPDPSGTRQYHVYRQVGDGPLTSIGTTPDTAFEDADPPRGVRLTYWVQGEGPAGLLTARVSVGETVVPARESWMRLTGLRGQITIRRPAAAATGLPGIRLASTGWATLGRVATMDENGTHVLIPATLGDRVQPGDELLVAPGGWAEMAMDGDQYVRLDEGTRMTVAEHIVDPNSGRQQTRLTVSLGRLWVNLLQKLAPSSRFEVETPTIVAGVRGTSFLADAAGQIVTMHGRVQVRPPGDPPQPAVPTDGAESAAPGDEEVILEPGDAASAAPGAGIVRDVARVEDMPVFAQVEVLKITDRLPEPVLQQVKDKVSEAVKNRAQQEQAEEAEQHQRVDEIRREQLQQETNERIKELFDHLPPAAQEQFKHHLQEPDALSDKGRDQLEELPGPAQVLAEDRKPQLPPATEQAGRGRGSDQRGPGNDRLKGGGDAAPVNPAPVADVPRGPRPDPGHQGHGAANATGAAPPHGDRSETGSGQSAPAADRTDKAPPIQVRTFPLEFLHNQQNAPDKPPAVVPSPGKPDTNPGHGPEHHGPKANPEKGHQPDKGNKPGNGGNERHDDNEGKKGIRGRSHSEHQIPLAII